jgi:tetrahydromethanopterin S-methyltransferase subunit F
MSLGDILSRLGDIIGFVLGILLAVVMVGAVQWLKTHPDR